MRRPALRTECRAGCLALLAAGLSVRPLVAAELNARLGVACDLLMVAAALAAIGLAGPRRLTPIHQLRLPVGLWLTAMVIAVALHGANAASIGDRLALAGGPLLMCAAATSWGPWRRRVIEGVCLMTAAISAFALWQGLALLPALASAATHGAETLDTALVKQVAARGRVLGTFTLPTLLAAHLSVVIPLILYTLNRSRAGHWTRRLPLWAVLVLAVLGWGLTSSIGAWLSLSAACAFVWFTRHRTPRWIALLTFALGLSGGLIVASRDVLWNRMSAHNPVRNRLVYWDAARRLIAEHPIAGLGPGRFMPAYRRVTTHPELGVRHAHNTYLQIWVEWGLVAIIAWGWLLLAIVRNTATLPPWLAVALWVLPLSNIVDFSFYISQVSLLWWYLAGWALRGSSLHITRNT